MIKTMREGRWVLISTVTASSMAFIASTVLNLASLPLKNELGADGVDLLWITNIFTLFLAALILLGGSLGDHFGRNRIFRIGIIIFGLASVACGVAPSVELLIIGRAVQGIGGALMVPGSLAIISASFNDQVRGQAIGTWSAVSTIASVFGPVVGGFLVDNGLWRGLFFLNVPLVILTLYALTKVPETRDTDAPRRLDYPGAVLITIGLAAITYGAIELGRRVPETTVQAILALVVGIIALVVFVNIEQRSDYPLVKLSLFKSRTFTGTNLMTFLLYAALGGALFFLSLNLTQVQRYPSTLAGAAFLPSTLLIGILSPFSGRLMNRVGARWLLTIGPGIAGIAFVLLGLQGVTAGASDYWTTFFPASIVLGIGMGLTVAPLTSAVMGAVPSHEAGVASGVNNAVSRAAGVLAVAILGAILLLIFSSALTGRLNNSEVPSDAQDKMLAASSNLGNITLPDGLNEAQTSAAQDAIRGAFVDAFRPVMFAGAALTWASALIAALLVEGRPAPLGATAQTNAAKV